MPTILTHPAVPLALGLGLGRGVVPPRLLAAGILCSTIPDLDVLAFHFGVPYASGFGHRGFTHSVAFALAAGLIGALLARALRAPPLAVLAFLCVATASHGVLDSFTDGGLGVAFLWPWSTERWFAPFRPIEVSPIGVFRLLTDRGARVLSSELLWVWLPCFVSGVALALPRMRRARASRARP
jgi:inner membrane protein